MVNDAIAQISNPYYYNNRGLILLHLGDLDSGLEDIDYSLYMDSSNSWALRNKGIYYYMSGDYEKSLKFLTNSVSVDSTNVMAFQYLDSIHLHLRD